MGTEVIDQRKQQALLQIRELVKQHGLSAEDLESCIEFASTISGSQERQKGLTVLFQYLGGIFLFSALGVFVGMYWGSLSDASRVLLTLGSGLVCYTLGWLYKSNRHSTILFLMAAPLEPTGMLIVLDTYFSVSSYYSSLLSALVFVVMAAQFYIAFSQRRLPVLLNGILVFSAIAYAFFCGWLDSEVKLGLPDELYGVVAGICFLGLTYRLRAVFHVSVLREMWYSASSLTLFLALHGWVIRSAAEPIYAGVVIACIWLSVHIRSLFLSIVSVAALLFYLGSLTSRMFDGLIAWPLTLLVIGGLCFWLQSVWAKNQK